MNVRLFAVPPPLPEKHMLLCEHVMGENNDVVFFASFTARRTPNCLLTDGDV